MTDPMDFQKRMTDLAAQMRMDPERLQQAFRAQAGYGEEFTKVALGAAEKSAELSAEFTREMLSKMGDLASVKEEPADYGRAMQEFVTSQGSAMQGQVSAFAQIVRDAQAQTIELMMKAAQTTQAQGAETMRGATDAAGKAANPKK